ncbi:MAG: TIGR00282 family metallophosphoesterase [bacterium]
MKLLFIGDIIGRPGRYIVKSLLPGLKEEFSPDIVIANGENAAAGIGITKKIYDELTDMGIDVITMGNHVWDRREFLPDISSCPTLIRPANYPEGAPGKGHDIFSSKGTKYGVINLVGRVFMPCINCPFQTANLIVAKINAETPIILVDFHGEATSEKNALAWYLDGKVSAVIGTHTHIQTADERILPKGTAFITDAGMVGSYDSVIGVQKEQIIKRFLSSMPERFEPEDKGPGLFNGLVIDIDDSGRAREIKRIYKIINDMGNITQTGT